jgi:hypothetical protein
MLFEYNKVRNFCIHKNFQFRLCEFSINKFSLSALFLIIILISIKVKKFSRFSYAAVDAI